MKSRVSRNILLLFPLLLAILLMGIGYAVINSVTGEIKGTAIANVQEGVFITNVEYVSDVDANLSNSEIKSYKGTLMQSAVALSSTNPASEIKYKVTVYNNSANSYPFLSVLYDGTNGEFYDNENIIFEIDPSGFNVGDVINANETKEIYITFKYKDGVLAPSAILNSYINFRIAEPNRLVLAQSVAATGNYLGSTVTKESIEIIKFEQGTVEPEGTIASFDASEKQNESIIGYYTDIDGNDLYELTFLSDEVIAANKNAQYLFQNLSSLTSIEFNNFSTFGVTNMESMFYSCSGLIELDISNFNTSQVTNMNYMFQSCSGLIQLDLSNFETSQVTNMGSMFLNCTGITKLNISNFETSQVTDMWYMFRKCKELTELDVSNFNTSQVKNMEYMFCECSKLTTLNVSNFDTSQVTNMQYMFTRCSGLTSLDVSNFYTSQVTNMAAMFTGCSGLTSLDVSNFYTSQVTKMSAMFDGCSGLTELDVSNFDTSQVTNMAAMFNGCGGLTELDVSNFDTSKVTNMQYMFWRCSGLTTVYVSEFNAETNTGWTTSAVTNSAWMFSGCSSLIGGNGTAYDSNYEDATYARIDTEEEPGYFTNILDKP